MQVRPNKSNVRGKVTAIRPEPDGWGAEVELEVTRNETPASREADDFVRPTAGSTLKAFYAEPGAIQVGDDIRAEARLNAGPTGGRVVLHAVEKAGGESSPPTVGSR